MSAYVRMRMVASAESAEAERRAPCDLRPTAVYAEVTIVLTWRSPRAPTVLRGLAGEEGNVCRARERQA